MGLALRGMRMMRLFAILISMVLLGQCVGAWGDDEKPPMEIAVFPGSEVTMEMNLTSEDIMPMLQAMLPLVGGAAGGVAKAVSPEEIANLLRNIRRIEVLQVDVRRAKTSLEEVSSFYGKNLPGGQWSRVFFSADDESSLAVYVDSASQSYYGFRTRLKADGARTIKEAVVAKVVGSIDFREALALGARLATAAAAQKGR